MPMGLFWSISMPRTSVFFSKSCGEKWKSREFNAKPAASSDVRSAAARCGLDRAQFADLGKNGHRNRELRAKYIQDRQPSSLFGCVRSRAVHEQSDRRSQKRQQQQFSHANG